VAPALDVPIRAAGPVRGPNGAAIVLPNLHLLGNLGPTGMAEAYASASVFASLARYEPFGLSVLEAARAGLRLVLSDIPTFRELWDGAAIFVRDEADLLPALRQALDGGPDPRAHAARYTVDAMVEGTLAVHGRIGARA
jgi:glycosyltransferase involved in cell wall biosynthesis